MTISATCNSTETEPVEVAFVGVMEGAGVSVKAGEKVWVGVGVWVAASVGVEVIEGEGAGVGVRFMVGAGVEVAAGIGVVTGDAGAVGVAVGAGVGVAVGVGANANGSITTRTMKAPKVLGLVKLFEDVPQNERLVLVELSNKRVFRGTPVVSITIKKLPESTTFKLEISRVFQPPMPTVEFVDIGGTISLEKLAPVMCMVKLSFAAYHA